MQFRRDINGLRAIAIIAVILFHFTPKVLSGGFAGVDVFFVISGFLMTAIIFKGFQNKTFSTVQFYISRANRIIPPLAFLSAILLFLGWFYLSPIDYKVLAKHVMGSLGFVSNFVYWREFGYFDAASYEKWLLHTWSLSVEWQFYIIYPIVLLFLKKYFSLNKIKLLILLAIVISFLVSIYFSIKTPIPAYYLLATRGWEMLFGALAYIYPIKLTNNNKKLLARVGLFLILLSYIFTTQEDSWPGYLAFIPVFGTYLVIVANCQKNILLNSAVFQSLGRWSYSIYLWHWPILVYSYYFPVKDWYLVGVPLSLFMGWISFKFIESYKFPTFDSWRKLIFIKPILFAEILILAAIGIYLSQGANVRYPDNENILIEKISSKIVMPHRGNGYCYYSFYHDETLKVDAKLGQNCFLGKQKENEDEKTNTLFFGDSFAGHNDPFWNEIFIENNKTYQSVSTSWCTPSFTKNFTGPKSDIAYKQCMLNRAFLKKSILTKQYKNIIFASNWHSVITQDYLDDFLEVISEANKQGIIILVMATPTNYIRTPIPLFFRSIYEHKDFDLSIYEREYKDNNYVNDFLAKKLEKYANVYFINRKMMFSTDNKFKFNTLRIPYSLDGNHMSLIGSLNAAYYFMHNQENIGILKILGIDDEKIQLNREEN